MKIRKRNGMLVIAVPILDPPRKSKSGKTLLVASSRGSRRTSFKMRGQNVVAIVSAYIRPDNYVKERVSFEPKKAARDRRLTQIGKSAKPVAAAKRRRL